MGTVTPCFGEDLVQRLILPERVIGRMVHDLVGEADLLEAVQPRHVARGTGREPGVVVVVVIGPPGDIAGAGGFLIVEVGQAVETKRAVVKPIVAPPAVDHGIDGHRRAQRRMRIHQRHERREAVVGDAENADLAVGFRECS